LSVAAAALISLPATAYDTSYLQGLLNTTPEGGWVKVNTTTFGSAFATGSVAAPFLPSGPEAVARAWSSFDWDSNRGQLIIYGGGHANYIGNEVYTMSGLNGQWTRGTLPSRVDIAPGTQWRVAGDGAPQSAHTFDLNVYAPGADRFVVFGGGAYNSGGPLTGGPNNLRTGVWWWDPSKADPNKVGGADGTGWNPATQGSVSWEERLNDPWRGLPINQGMSYLNGTNAYRSENGRDVIYLSIDSNASGLPQLWRYQLGINGGPDTWARVGTTQNSVMREGTAAIDTNRGLFVRTAQPAVGRVSDLAVWNLANNNTNNPGANLDFSVRLVDINGNPLDTSIDTAIEYDQVNDQFVLWDGNLQGTVWVTKPEYLPGGAMDPIWTVHVAPSTTFAQPAGNHVRGVLGKWKYISELGAFIAMDEWNNDSRDASIWMYKPYANVIPEPGTWALLLAGLGVVAGIARRRRVA
jgi:hypothetical protein